LRRQGHPLIGQPPVVMSLLIGVGDDLVAGKRAGALRVSECAHRRLTAELDEGQTAPLGAPLKCDDTVQ